MDLKEYIRSIPDYPKKGILFRDITTLIKNEKAFINTIDQIIEKSKNFKIDKIAAIESRGFVFASAVSYLLKKPFVLLRKKNKIPADTYSVAFQFEYGKDKDPREDLFKYAVKNKWSILKMNPKTTNLEDIFRDLTMEGKKNV